VYALAVSGDFQRCGRDQSWLQENLETVPLNRPRPVYFGLQVKGTHHTVLFCFLLNITNLLGDLLETVLIVCVLKLQFYIEDLINKSDHFIFAKGLNVTNLAASVVLVVVPSHCEESDRMSKKFLEGFSKMASSVPRDSGRKETQHKSPQ
jgi:hypothetical protein